MKKRFALQRQDWDKPLLWFMGIRKKDNAPAWTPHRKDAKGFDSKAEAALFIYEVLAPCETLAAKIKIA